MTEISSGIQLTPFDPVFARDTCPVYRRLREAAPVHRDGDACLVSGYAEVAALRNDGARAGERHAGGIRRHRLR